MKRRTVLTAMLGLPVLGAAGVWLHERQLQAYADAAIVFGTTISINVLHADETAARNALSAALKALR